MIISFENVHACCCGYKLCKLILGNHLVNSIFKVGKGTKVNIVHSAVDVIDSHNPLAQSHYIVCLWIVPVSQIFLITFFRPGEWHPIFSLMDCWWIVARIDATMGPKSYPCMFRITASTDLCFNSTAKIPLSPQSPSIHIVILILLYNLVSIYKAFYFMPFPMLN